MRIKKIVLSLLALSSMLIIASDGSNASGGGSKADHSDSASVLSDATIDRKEILLRKECMNPNTSQEKVFHNPDLCGEITTFLSISDGVRHLGTVNHDFFKAAYNNPLIRCTHAAKIAQEIVLNYQLSSSPVPIGFKSLSNGRGVITLPNGVIQVWNPNIPQGEPGHMIVLTGNQGRVYFVDVLSNGRIVLRSDDHTIRVWNPDIAAGEPGHLVELTGYEGHANSVAVLSNGRIALGSYNGGTVRVWNPDIAAGEPGHLVELTRDAGVGSFVRALRDGRCVSFSNSGIVRVWNLDIPVDEPGYMVQFNRYTSFRRAENSVTAVEVLPDGRIVLGLDNGVIQIWNPNISAGKPGHLVELAAHESRIMKVAVLDDGRIVSLGEGDGTLRVWNADISQGEPGHMVEPTLHTGRVLRFVISPKGRIILLLTPCFFFAPFTVAVWNPCVLAEKSGYLKEFVLGSNCERNITLLSDGHIVLMSDDNTIRLKSGNEQYFEKKIKRTQAIEDYIIDGPGVFYALFPHGMHRVIKSINEHGNVEIAKRRLRLLLEEYYTIEGAGRNLLRLKDETYLLKLKSFTIDADLQALQDKIAALVNALGNVNLKVFGINKNLREWSVLLDRSSNKALTVKEKKCASNKRTISLAAVTAVTVVAGLVAVGFQNLTETALCLAANATL